MNFWTIFAANVIVSFFFSYVLVRYGKQHEKDYKYFTDAPLHRHLEKIILNSTYKFKVEYGLSLFLIPAAMVMLAILSYLLTLPLPGIDQVEYVLMIMLGEFVLIVSTAVMTKVTLETIFQDKELREVSAHELFITEKGFTFPITPLEGEWREIARKARKFYMTLETDQLAQLDVVPARGSTFRPKPAYYRITLKDHPRKIHFQRNQFYGNEKKFLDIVASRGIKIVYEDKVRD